MRSVGIRELKAHTSKILREAQDRREVVEVTNRRRVVARIVPADCPPTAAERARTAAVLADLDELAAEISKYWPKGVSAVDAVREQRRDL